MVPLLVWSYQPFDYLGVFISCNSAFSCRSYDFHVCCVARVNNVSCALRQAWNGSVCNLQCTSLEWKPISCVVMCFLLY